MDSPCINYYIITLETEHIRRMAYGYKPSGFKRSSARRASTSATRYTRPTYRKMASRTVSRPTVAARLSHSEIKYDDDYWNLNAWTLYTQGIAGTATGFVNYVMGGMVGSQLITLATGAVDAQNLMTAYGRSYTQMPNCVSNVSSGTTAKTRIGNLIAPRYVTIKGVMVASTTNDTKDGETTNNTESGVDPVSVIARYIRTSIKLYVIRDKSMNEKGYVSFTDVFEEPENGNLIQQSGAANPFLWNRKVNSIGRYDIIKEYEFELDQDDPQRAFQYTVPLLGKNIRYNGSASSYQVQHSMPYNETGQGRMTIAGVANTISPMHAMELTNSVDAQSMTNGIYILAVSHSSVGTANNQGYTSPSMVFSSRLTFNDN